MEPRKMRKFGGFRLRLRWRCKMHLRLKIRARLGSDGGGESWTRRIWNWGRRIGGRWRYRRLEEEEVEAVTPRGHLAVYVGGGRKGEEEVEGGPQRYVVPVIYFNHPLFGELLKEAEAEFGFQHPGGITIPCPVSKFERVQTRIAATGPGKKSGLRLL